MLRKLLKYDFKAVIKLWLIGVIAILLLSVLGGFAIKVDTFERELPPLVYTISVLVEIFTFIGYAAFSVLTQVLIFIRFYKNFFTDEGYLTFTLPVSRSKLLNSKLIMCTVVTWLSGCTTIFGYFLMLAIGHSEFVFTLGFLKMILKTIGEIIESFGVYFFIYIIELFAISMLYSLLSVLFLSSCITLASTVVKRAKVITAIGIYYGISNIVTTILFFLMLFGTPTLAQWFSKVPEPNLNLLMMLVFLCIILFMMTICAVLYTFQHWMLKRKLNLS